MTLLEALPLILSALGIIAAYINLSLNIEKREKDRDEKIQKELKEYVDKEINHNKNLYATEIKHLTEKIDKLLELVEKMRGE